MSAVYRRHTSTQVTASLLGTTRLSEETGKLTKRRNPHPCKNIGIEKSSLCPCGLEAQTTAHVLQACPLHKRERESTLPTESSLGNKLHGTATELRLTVRFIALTGLQI